MWDKTFNSGTAWIHMNGFKRRSNANVFYSPGVDRMFAVDSADPYTAYEVALLLSSKVPGIAVCILTVEDPWFDNSNCHQYTLKDKLILSPGSSILFNRQLPMIRKLPTGSIINVGALPSDYTNNENYKQFLALQEYAKFVIQAWHSAKICEMYFNFAPMEMFAKEFFGELLPENFAVQVDNINGDVQTGITKEIKKILYTSNSPEEALDLIHNAWRRNITPFSTYWKDTFYKMIEVVPPEDLRSAERNTDRYSGYLL